MPCPTPHVNSFNEKQYLYFSLENNATLLIVVLRNPLMKMVPLRS